jgi:hypothetical protein
MAMVRIDSLRALRLDLADRSQWSIGYLAAGLVYWTCATLIGILQPEPTVRVYWAVGGGFIFPVAVLLSRAWNADPFSRGNPLGTLIGVAHASSIWLLMPLVVVLWIDFPAGMPLALAICLGASYPVLSWAFGDPVFLWHIIIRVTGVAAIWLALPHRRYTLLPAFVAVLYAATLVVVPARRRRWMAANQDDVSTPQL